MILWIAKGRTKREPNFESWIYLPKKNPKES